MQMVRSVVLRRGVLKRGEFSPILRLQPTSRRTYATSPPQEHVVSAFSTPLSNFIYTISRIARIIVFTGVGLGTVGLATFEGVHQYVEHVALPKNQASNQGEDPWGWLQESQDERWSSGSGTDSRLGFRGRHLLRGAWIYANWGGGISPSSFISPGAGLSKVSGKQSATTSFTADEGLDKSEIFLLETLTIAEERGIRIPDLAAIRAGLHPPEAMQALSKALDWTAIDLECKLASTRERLGTTKALMGALSGYTRVFDVLIHVDATNRAMKAEGHDSGRADIRTDRLIRLATKVGDLHGLLGNRNEAENWLLHAVSLAGQTASESTNEKARQDITRNEIIAGVGGLTPIPAEVTEAQNVAQGMKHKQAPTHTPALLEHLSSEAPSPALTRSLISTLLSLSAFYAVPDNKTQLEKALQFQASALRLARVEQQRLALSDDKDQIGPSLHSLWLAHHDALASIHIAETMYALGSASSSSFGAMIGSLGMGSKSDKNAQTLQWLNEADQIARSVAQSLGKKTSQRLDEPMQLDAKWKGSVQYEVPAKRLLRDSIRLKLSIQEMKKAL